MIDHVSIGVRDLGRAKAFYDAAQEPLGFHCVSQDDSSLGYGGESASFWVIASEAPPSANPSSGLHICLSATNRRSVDAFHAAALARGGRDNGHPGLRSDCGPNRLEACCNAGK